MVCCRVARSDDIVIALVHAHQLSCPFGCAVWAADCLPAELLNGAEGMPHLDDLGPAGMREHADRDDISVNDNYISPCDSSFLLHDRTKIAGACSSLVLGQQLAQRPHFMSAIEKLTLQHLNVQSFRVTLTAYYCDFAWFIIITHI